MAQKSSFIFHNIGERQGLSANFSYSILKDSRGIMWIGTLNGLSRFDGVHFNVFRSGKDSLSIINNTIFDLCEDKEGNIWGATSSGIFCYHVKSNRFKNYIPHTYDYARGLTNIICDKKGNIWATTIWNIQKLNRKKDVFEEIEPLTTNYDSLGAYSVRYNGLVEDPSGNGLWFATRSGLHFYNTSEEKFYSYKNSAGDALFNNHGVAALSLSKTGYCWFFDNVTKDIISFDPKTHKIVQRINMNASIPNAYATTLVEDSHHMLWFSTWGNKMAVIDYKKNDIIPISYKNDNPLSIAGDVFWDAWEDDDNNIWLATSGGLSKCNYSKNLYSILPMTEKVAEFKNNKLGAFDIDPRDNSWWIASDDEVNVIHYYPKTEKYELYNFSKALKNSKGNLPSIVYGINFIDGQPYACTHSGVWMLNEKTKKIIPFEKKFEGLPAMHYHYCEEHNNDVWFTTKDGHVKWNKTTNKSMLIKAALDSFPDGQSVYYGRLYFDSTLRPWYVPAFGWLANINKKQEVTMKYYVKNKAKELSGYITSVSKDKRDNFWMSSVGVGLYKYNIAKDEMTLFDQSDGITNNIGATILDKKDLLWIGAGNKFSVFNTVTNSIKHYNLPIYENTIDYRNVFALDSSGAILVVVNKDIVKFLPDRLSLKPQISAPLISSIKISGKEKLLTNESNLILEPNENALEFSFGSLISNEIFPYSFEYTLEGFDEKWIPASNIASALYNNLAPGKYTFRVRAVANDKSWQTPENIIQFVIRTPFYKATWFWFLIGSFLVATLIFFYRFRLNKQKQIHTLETKSQLLEKEKSMVMYESLKQQLNPHFLFNSLTSLSGLIDTDQDLAGSFLEQMSGIYRYILKNGDNEAVSLKDEIEFVKLYIKLQQTRFKTGLQVNISIGEEYLHYKIAPVTLQNLIENAIKHNVIDAESPLTINIFIDDDYIVVKNNLNKKKMVETSNKKGLIQFETFYKYLSEKPIIIDESTESYTIKIPLI